MQDDRERYVVRRFKFEELRVEQIHDLEVYPCLALFFGWNMLLFCHCGQNSGKINVCCADAE